MFTIPETNIYCIIPLQSLAWKTMLRCSQSSVKCSPDISNEKHEKSASVDIPQWFLNGIHLPFLGVAPINENSHPSSRLGEPEYTTWKLRPKGEIKRCIDYIFHSSSLLSSDVGRDVGFQNKARIFGGFRCILWNGYVWVASVPCCHVSCCLCYLILLVLFQHLDL